MIIKKTSAGVVLSSLVVMVVLLNASRYIFRFGWPGASQGYLETPIIFWVIKYFLILGIFVVIALKIDKIKLWHCVIYGVAVIFSAIGAYEADHRLIQMAALYICLYGLLFVMAISSRSFADFEQAWLMTKALWLFAGSGMLFLVAQIALYLGIGLMPSHSYAGSMLIRFGSFLDDSLAFGILLPMFAGLCFHGIRDGVNKMMALIVICLMAVLTGSFTAMGVTGLFVAWLFRRNWIQFIAWLGFIGLLVFTFRWQFQGLWEAKSGSIALHLGGWDGIAGGEKVISGGEKVISGARGFVESGFLLIYKNFSLPVLGVILTFHAFTFLACRRLLKNSKAGAIQPFVGAVEGLNFSAVVASFNLPVIMIFPVFLLLALFSAIVIGLDEKLSSKRQS